VIAASDWRLAVRNTRADCIDETPGYPITVQPLASR